MKKMQCNWFFFVVESFLHLKNKNKPRAQSILVDFELAVSNCTTAAGSVDVCSYTATKSRGEEADRRRGQRVKTDNSSLSPLRHQRERCDGVGAAPLDS